MNDCSTKIGFEYLANRISYRRTIVFQFSTLGKTGQNIMNKPIVKASQMKGQNGIWLLDPKELLESDISENRIQSRFQHQQEKAHHMGIPSKLQAKKTGESLNIKYWRCTDCKQHHQKVYHRPRQEMKWYCIYGTEKTKWSIFWWLGLTSKNLFWILNETKTNEVTISGAIVESNSDVEPPKGWWEPTNDKVMTAMLI